MIEPRQTVREASRYAPPPEGRRGFVRLDFNENTLGPPCRILESDSDTVSMYPEYGSLTKAMAAHWHLNAENVLPTNGSDEAIATVAWTFIEPGRDTAVIARPNFPLIRHYLQIAGARLNEVPLNNDLQYDTAALETMMGQCPKLVFLASPDNPSGATIESGAVHTWCQRHTNTLFVIDEAYAEYSDSSVLPLVKTCRNLLVLRSFSKAWGIAGLRLGAILGDETLIEYLRRVRSPYSVNSYAVRYALELLANPESAANDACEALRRKRLLVAALREVNYTVHDCPSNFFLIRIDADAANWCEELRKRGILVRDRSQIPGLPGMVRVSVGSEEENARLLGVLRDLRQRSPEPSLLTREVS